MTPEQLIARIRAIRGTHPGNLMARHFDEDYFRSLDDPSRQRLRRIISSGIENPDSQMGAYAMYPEDYDQFAPMLDPMIRDFHGIPAETAIAHKADWDTGAMSCDLAAIDGRLKDVSMRVRVARNVSAFPLPGAMSKEQRVALENLAARAFARLADDPAFGGRYLSITPGSADEIDAAEYDRRVKTHQMFKDMSGDPYLNVAGISADWPYGRGMYVSGDEDFLVWVGEEDHLRIMAMQHGGNLNALFERLRNGLERLRDLLPAFAASPRYGNVTSCPTNLGAGMRASLHMRLPGLSSNGRDLTRLKRQAKALGLAVRGAGGEHSDAGEGGLVDISPSARLGVTEKEIMRRLYDGAAALWAMETA
jgi:creatine kinase